MPRKIKNDAKLSTTNAVNPLPVMALRGKRNNNVKCTVKKKPPYNLIKCYVIEYESSASPGWIWSPCPRLQGPSLMNCLA